MIIIQKITHSTIFIAKIGLFIVKSAIFLYFFICQTNKKWSDDESKPRNIGEYVAFAVSCDKGLKNW